MTRVKDVVGPKLDNLFYNSEQGMLETVHYIFEKSNTGTVILFDSGSTTSLITAKSAGNLYLKGTEKSVCLC